MHDSAYQDAQRFVAKHLDRDARLDILDVGSFDVNGCLRPLMHDPPLWFYFGADLKDGKNVDVVLSSPYSWPGLKDGAFDVVVSSQTIEHVLHPWRWIHEVARVLKHDGLLYLCTPNTWPYHAFPVDCYRFWPDGLRALLGEPGCLEILECYHKGPDTTAIARKHEAAPVL